MCEVPSFFFCILPVRVQPKRSHKVTLSALLASVDCALTLEFPSKNKVILNSFDAEKGPILFFLMMQKKLFFRLESLSVNLHLIFCCSWLPQFWKASSNQFGSAYLFKNKQRPTRVQGLGGPKKNRETWTKNKTGENEQELEHWIILIQIDF